MRILLIVLAVLSTSVVRPAMADGHVSPELAGAVEAWLADDDATALPVISAMAEAGDQTAQLLISQIERETPAGGETDWVLALDRNARKSLFRAPGGLSGTPWVKKLAADGNPLAKALELSKQPDATIETAKTLFEAGEVEQAKRLTWEILERGRFDAVLNLPPDAPLQASLDYLPWMKGWFLGGAVSAEQRKWILVSPKRGRLTGMVLVSKLAPLLNPALAPRAPVVRVTRVLQGSATEVSEEGLEGVGFAAKLLERQGRSDPDLAPLKNMCERLCGDKVGLCLLGSVALLGGYERVLIQDSPYEAVISQADYVASQRAQNTAERRLRAAAKRFAGASGYEVSQCLANEFAE